MIKLLIKALALSLFSLAHSEIVWPQTLPVEIPIPSTEDVPQIEQLPPTELPPANELLEPIEELPEQLSLPIDGPEFSITSFEFDGNTAFTVEELQVVTQDFIGDDQTFADVAAARDAITELYVENGYITSGAIAPPQAIENGVVQIQIVEGELTDIEVQGTRNLKPSYISSRIRLGAATPLNVDRLIERLLLLQIDPLVENISADLRASPVPGANRLVVQVEESELSEDNISVNYTLDNNRPPSVGTIRQQLRLTRPNFSGAGDSFSTSFNFTELRSISFINDIDYRRPISPHGTSVQFSYRGAINNITEEPFDVLKIRADSFTFELGVEHPLLQTPTSEFTLGLTASHKISQTFLGLDDIGPTPLSPGADENGVTRVSALRFFQTWTKRSPQQALALRSQLNIGLDILNATVNDDAPDSRFFSWEGQAQWVRILAPDTPLILRGNTQIAFEPLLGLEQISLGGQSTVRGYRQDLLSTDNGILGSAEVRFPIWRDSDSNRLLQITPFIEGGYGWNARDDSPNPLASAGIGLLFRQQDLTARIDWGIPLINSAQNNSNSWQENGIYFSLQYPIF